MVNFIKREFLFIIFLSLFILLPKKSFNEYISYIDWPTILSLSGFLLLTLGIKESKFFDYLAIKFINSSNNERNLAFKIILIAYFLSFFMINDIILFTLIPLVLSLKKYLKNDLNKIIILLAITVNVNALTPISNPQNIFIYNHYNLTFTEFINIMFLPVSIMTVILIIFMFILFRKTPLNINIKEKIQIDKKFFIITSIIFLIFLYLIEKDLHFLGFIIIFFFFLFAKKEIFLKFDYFLILTFILMFIDFKLISELNFIKQILHQYNMNNFKVILLISTLLSQIISNVPTAIFMSHFSNNYKAILWGINIAGNGIIIASIANLIAIRLGKIKILEFQKISIFFFILSLIIITLCKS